MWHKIEILEQNAEKIHELRILRQTNGRKLHEGKSLNKTMPKKHKRGNQRTKLRRKHTRGKFRTKHCQENIQDGNLGTKQRHGNKQAGISEDKIGHRGNLRTTRFGKNTRGGNLWTKQYRENIRDEILGQNNAREIHNTRKKSLDKTIPGINIKGKPKD